ncbi:MAG: SPFH domain-containing protein [Candidatus Bathyarchaeota archaeon]|nr:SPFH domain-containing protein [Candidatus Bathyarchaeota archaeon]
MLIVLIILFVILPLTVFRSVGVGYGVILVDPLAGSVSEPVIGPTWFFKAPWVSDVHIYYAVDSVGMWTEAGVQGEYPAITAISKDGLSIEVDVLVRWSLKPTELKEIYQTFPRLDWKDRVVSSVIREVARNVISDYTAIQIIENRLLITQDLGLKITTSLIAEESLKGSLDPSTIEIDLRDITPPPKFLQAIEDKLAAQQAKLQAEYEREKILILANATATQQIIEAEGEASSRLIIANGTAESIRIIAERAGMNATELTNLYMTLEALKDMAKTAKTFVVVLGEDGLVYMLPVGEE